MGLNGNITIYTGKIIFQFISVMSFEVFQLYIFYTSIVRFEKT